MKIYVLFGLNLDRTFFERYFLLLIFLCGFFFSYTAVGSIFFSQNYIICVDLPNFLIKLLQSVLNIALVRWQLECMSAERLLALAALDFDEATVVFEVQMQVRHCVENASAIVARSTLKTLGRDVLVQIE